MQHEAVVTFIRSLAHREQVEAMASVLSSSTTTSITYARPLAWPWPRQFNYTTEFFCADLGADSLREIQKIPASEGDHVVNLFAPDPERESQSFLEVGYAQAWLSGLYGRALAADWVRPLPDGVRIHEVKDVQDMGRFSSLLGISNPGTARDIAVHNFFATVGSQVVAKGQLVFLPGSTAYISDMFCSPEHRRKGFCHAIMRALEDKARKLGATHACLAPGHEVMSYDLYAKYGYRQVASRSVLVSPAKPDAH